LERTDEQLDWIESTSATTVALSAMRYSVVFCELVPTNMDSYMGPPGLLELSGFPYCQTTFNYIFENHDIELTNFAGMDIGSSIAKTSAPREGPEVVRETSASDTNATDSRIAAAILPWRTGQKHKRTKF
jgi:hypothetical protein